MVDLPCGKRKIEEPGNRLSKGMSQSLLFRQVYLLERGVSSTPTHGMKRGIYKKASSSGQQLQIRIYIGSSGTTGAGGKGSHIALQCRLYLHVLYRVEDK